MVSSFLPSYEPVNKSTLYSLQASRPPTSPNFPTSKLFLFVSSEIFP